jgi:hypothetical protein
MPSVVASVLGLNLGGDEISGKALMRAVGEQRSPVAKPLACTILTWRA